MPNNDCRIYVACLASYNNGVLHGSWIDAAQDADAIQEEVNAMLRASRFPNVTVDCPDCNGEGGDTPGGCQTCKATGKVPSAEEWAIHDFEGFHSLKLSESEGFDSVALHAAMIEKHGAAWPAYVDHFGSEYATEEGFEGHYRGEWDSVKAYAENLIDDMGYLKESEFLARYFDYDAFANDLEMGGDIAAVEDGGTVYIFDNH